MTSIELTVLLLIPLLLSVVLGKGDVAAAIQSIQQNQQRYQIATLQAVLFVFAGIVCLFLMFVETTPYGVDQAQFGSIICFVTAALLWLLRGRRPS